MSEFHYTVIYNSEVGAWSVEPDPACYYPDGNIYDKYKYLAEGYGWHFPEEGSDEEALDYSLYLALQSIAHTLPIPQEA